MPELKINEDLKLQKKPYKQYVFGGEESFGLLAGDFVRDKDAVISSAMAAEMAAYLKYNKKTVLEYLDEIYEKYGYFNEALRSIVLKGVDGIEKIKKIMDTFRKTAPSSVCGLKLLKLGDIEKGFIRAEVVSYTDFVQYGGSAGAKDHGKLRAEGRNYPVQDGDVILFLHN